MTAIRINELTKAYDGKVVLDIPSLEIPSGQLVGLVGNNGAGKTTLLRLTLDLIGATTGQVLSEGLDVAQSEEWKSYTGSFLDRHFLIDFYTVEEYFALIAELYGIAPAEMEERLEPFMPLMHDELLGQRKFIRDFSEGNRQKIGIIGAMFIRPRVLLLDEPFNYLDPSSQIIVARLIAQQCELYGTTVIISSHNLNSVADISHRILLLEHGRILHDLMNHDSSAFDVLHEYFNMDTDVM